MTEKVRIPQIRFKGFTDPWEQRQVGELLFERNQKAPMSEEYPLMAFIANEGVAPKGERYDRSALVTDTENKLYKKTEFGDFIYSSNNLETGSIGLNKYGKASISPVYSIFEPTGIADSDFLGRRLVRKDFINAMVKWRQGVIYGQWRIHESDFIKIEIAVPKVHEQRKIGVLLDQLDNLITLHQCKHDKLVNVKKSLLEKMFPSDGEKVPKIRFKGFTDPWEQRKLIDVVDYIVDNRGKNPAYYCDSGIPVIDNFMIGELYPELRTANRFIDNYLFESFIRKYNKLDDILVTLVGNGIGKMSLFPNKKAVIIQNTLGFRCDNHNKKFCYYELLSKNKEIISLDRGMAQPSIRQDELLNIEFNTTKIQEEEKIGNLFYNLDNLITLHQSKLEKLKNIKKSLLEKMFV